MSKDGFVLDTSVTVSWFFPDEHTPSTQAILRSLASDFQAVDPVLWSLEVTNVLVVGERRKRSTPADSATWHNFLSALPITVDGETNARAWTDTLGIARSQNLSVYDAAYLELAMRRGLPLATLDDRLKAAASSVGVVIYVVP